MIILPRWIHVLLMLNVGIQGLSVDLIGILHPSPPRPEVKKIKNIIFVILIIIMIIL